MLYDLKFSKEHSSSTIRGWETNVELQIGHTFLLNDRTVNILKSVKDMSEKWKITEIEHCSDKARTINVYLEPM